MTCTPTPASSAAASARGTAPTASPAPYACSSPPSEQLGLLALEPPRSTPCGQSNASMDETSPSGCGSKGQGSVEGDAGGWVATKSVSDFLTRNHYLGPVTRGFAWSDRYGVLVLAKPTSRRLPQDGTWLELVRWCLIGGKNGGSQQLASVMRAVRDDLPSVTTIVSYSDPAAGHNGALYRACGFVWRPTWMRLSPPPTGNGSWSGEKTESVKDRWVYPVKPDARRESLLISEDVIRAFYRRFVAEEK